MRVQCKTQKTPEWFNARLGKVTASNIARAMKRLKRASGEKKAGDWAAEHDNYVEELAWEIVTGKPAEHWVSPEMDVGTQYEPDARMEYFDRLRAEFPDAEVATTGFVLHPTLDFLGCSPDGLVFDGTFGGLEGKVPKLTTHQKYILGDVVPADYVLQMQCGMLCCELPWWDFTSYAPPEVYPEFPSELRLFRKRLFADTAVFAEMEEAARVTSEQAHELADLIRGRMG